MKERTFVGNKKLYSYVGKDMKGNKAHYRDCFLCTGNCTNRLCFINYANSLIIYYY